MDIIKRVTKNAESLLRSLKADYYIKLPTGAVIRHGFENLEMAEKPKAGAAAKPAKVKKERQASHGQKWGALTAHFVPILRQCKKAGDIAEIPFGEFDSYRLRGSVAAWCSHEWGKETYTTTINKVRSRVEVMRTVDEKQPAAPASTHKTNGAAGLSKFRSAGHGLDALSTLQFDDEQQQQP